MVHLLCIEKWKRALTNDGMRRFLHCFWSPEAPSLSSSSALPGASRGNGTGLFCIVFRHLWVIYSSIYPVNNVNNRELFRKYVNNGKSSYVCVNR